MTALKLATIAGFAILCVPPTQAQTPVDLTAHGGTIFVRSHTYFVKAAEMEAALVKKKELSELNLRVTDDQNIADFILDVRRAAFQNNFPYTLSHRQTGVVVAGGEVNSLGGTVSGKVASGVIKKLKELRENPSALRKKRKNSRDAWRQIPKFPTCRRQRFFVQRG